MNIYKNFFQSKPTFKEYNDNKQIYFLINLLEDRNLFF